MEPEMVWLINHWISNQTHNRCITDSAIKFVVTETVQLNYLQGHTHAIQQGWMLKTNFEKQKPVKQRRWCVLKSNTIEYFKSSDRNAVKVGSMSLNSLCIVSPPDENTYVS